LLDKSYFAPNATDERCYLGMFRGDTLGDGEWDLGSIVMQDYYIVYDLEVKMDD
jgi:hypothetical protein